jgi:hypothetical protein
MKVEKIIKIELTIEEYKTILKFTSIDDEALKGERKLEGWEKFTKEEIKTIASLFFELPNFENIETNKF